MGCECVCKSAPEVVKRGGVVEHGGVQSGRPRGDFWRGDSANEVIGLQRHCTAAALHCIVATLHCSDIALQRHCTAATLHCSGILTNVSEQISEQVNESKFSHSE